MRAPEVQAEKERPSAFGAALQRGDGLAAQVAGDGRLGRHRMLVEVALGGLAAAGGSQIEPAGPVPLEVSQVVRVLARVAVAGIELPPEAELSRRRTEPRPDVPLADVV